MAYMVQIRCDKDPDLADLLRARLAKEPAELTTEYLERAQAIDPSQARAEQKVLVGASLIAGQLRTGNRQAALEFLIVTLRRLEGFRDRQLAEAWRNALLDLRSYLEGSIPLSHLKKHPQLDEILRVLERR